MAKQTIFTPDSVWCIGNSCRTLKEWSAIYELEFSLVQERMIDGDTILKALTRRRGDKKWIRSHQKRIAREMDELISQYPPVEKMEKFDTFKELEKDIPKRNYLTLTESYIERILYGKDNINQLTTY